MGDAEARASDFERVHGHAGQVGLLQRARP